ncbi:MAG: hypothetical protein P4L42_00550 [Desulfocapsaceae bacterium]|nr:hypothetical protein [Desulfocapsaceae bacterium]
MITSSNGLQTYGSSEQVLPPPEEKIATTATAEKDARSNGFITDKTELSARALALSRNIPAAGSASEQTPSNKETTSSGYKAGTKPSSSINIHV